MEPGPASVDEEPPPSAFGFLPPGAGMPICPDCGAIAPSARTSCELCGADFGGTPPSAPALGDEMFWVVVRCEFQCRSCGFFVPLNHLDVDGTVDCMRCGVQQVFDVDSWRVGLTAAHEIGDLAGPDPEGRFRNPARSIGGDNPFRRIGVSATCGVSHQSARYERDGGVHYRSLKVTAAPGHPLCDDCNAPLEVKLSGRTARATCSGCGERAVYETPQAGRTLYHSLVAALAPEHRTDATDATEDASTGGAALAVRCPNCSAPIPVDGVSPFESCDFCHTSVRIREQTMRKLVSEPRPLPWWLLYRGPSEKRIELEQQLAMLDGKPTGTIESPPMVKRSFRNRAIRAGLPLSALLLVGLLGFWDEVELWRRAIDSGNAPIARVDPIFGASPSPTQTPTPARVPGRSPPPSPSEPVEPVEPVVTHSSRSTECRCRLAERKLAQLVIDARPGAEGWQLSPRLEITGEPPFALPVGSDTAPPQVTASPALSLGIACRGDEVVLAWERRVTTWSVTSRGYRWTTELPRALRGKPARASSPSLRCRALQIRGDLVKLPLKSGSISLRLSDGRAR